MSPLQEKIESVNSIDSPEAAPVHNFMSSLARKGRKEIFAVSIGLVALSGCASVQRSFKRLLGPSQSDALSAISDRNFPLAKRYYDDQYCEEVADHLERCEEGAEKKGCQINGYKMDRCDEVADGTSNTIDSFKEKIKENVAKYRFDEAIKYIDSILSMLEEEDDLSIELTKKRTEYVNRIKSAEKEYLKTMVKVGAMVMKVDIDPKVEFKESTWDELRQLIEKARVDREIIAESDKALFLHVVELTKRVSKRGDLKKAALAVRMCEAVDLGNTNFETVTQATDEDKALFGAIAGEVNQQRADRKGKILEIMNALTPIEKKLDVFFAAKGERRKEIAKEIVAEANVVYRANEEFINSIEGLRQRVRTIYLQLDPKTRRRPRRRRPRRVVVVLPQQQPATATEAAVVAAPEQAALDAAGNKRLGKLKKKYANGSAYAAIAGLEGLIAEYGSLDELMKTRGEWDKKRQELIKKELDRAYELKAEEDFAAIEHFEKALRLNPDDIDERRVAKQDLKTMKRRKKKFEEQE